MSLPATLHRISEFTAILRRAGRHQRRLWSHGLTLKSIRAQLRFEHGKADRLSGEPCRSNHGVYLNGWYFDQFSPNYYILPAQITELVAQLEEYEAEERNREIRRRIFGRDQI